MPALALALAIVAQAPSPQDEQDVHRYIQAAAALYRSLDNDRALEQLSQAKAVPHRPDDLVQISLYEGLILSDQGKRPESEAAFRTAFALDPDAKLPMAVSPKLEAWIEGLRAKTRRELDRVPKSVDAATPEAAPLPSSHEAASETAASPAPAWHVSPWIPSAVAVGFFAGAGACALAEHDIEQRLSSGDPSITTPSQLATVYQQGRLYTGLGISMAIAGGVALAAAGVFFWRDAQAPATVSIVPGPNGAALVLSGSL